MSSTTKKIEASLSRRHKAEKRFQWYGKIALGFALSMLALLMFTIILPGMQGFFRHEMALEVDLPAKDSGVHFRARSEAARALNALFPDVKARREKRALQGIMAASASDVVQQAYDTHKSVGESVTVWVPLADTADLFLKGKIDETLPEYSRNISDQQIAWIKALQKKGVIRYTFNASFFTGGDSREPEIAGFGGSIVGSLLTMLVCMAVAFPVGVFAAVYLEEFSARNRLRDLIEVNINNLAAVPSIVFGLLGLAIFLNLFGMPRSAPLVGGLTLALMTLPVIIITTRASLRAIPDSIRDAARGLGASPLQVVTHHVLPLAMPGIMTGMILGVARAIGETAPLLMIGMVAFIADVPSGITDPASAMPVQIYLWASSPELGFAEKTAAGIIVLIAILLAMNAIAIYLRKRYERKW